MYRRSFLFVLGLFVFYLLYQWYLYRKEVKIIQSVQPGQIQFRTGDLLLFRYPNSSGAHFAWWQHMGIILETKDASMQLAEFGNVVAGQPLTLRNPQAVIEKNLLKGRILAYRRFKGTANVSVYDMNAFLDRCRALTFEMNYRRAWVLGSFFKISRKDKISCAGFVGMVLSQLLKIGPKDGFCLGAISPGQFSSNYTSGWDQWYDKEVYLSLS